MTDIDEYDDEEREAYDDDLAAQNAVDDAKWDAMTPLQEEPPEDWHRDAPTHYALAEELIETVGRMEYGTNESRETLMLAQVRATLAMTDQLADALSIFRHSRQMTRTCSLEHPVLDGPFGGTDAEGLEGALERLHDGLRLRDRDSDGSWQYVRARVADLREVLPEPLTRDDEPVVWELRRIGSVPRLFARRSHAEATAERECAERFPDPPVRWLNTGASAWTLAADLRDPGWTILMHHVHESVPEPEEVVVPF